MFVSPPSKATEAERLRVFRVLVFDCVPGSLSLAVSTRCGSTERNRERVIRPAYADPPGPGGFTISECDCTASLSTGSMGTLTPVTESGCWIDTSGTAVVAAFAALLRNTSGGALPGVLRAARLGPSGEDKNRASLRSEVGVCTSLSRLEEPLENMTTSARRVLPRLAVRFEERETRGLSEGVRGGGATLGTALLC